MIRAMNLAHCHIMPKAELSSVLLSSRQEPQLLSKMDGFSGPERNGISGRHSKDKGGVIPTQVDVHTQALIKLVH